jgi:hypothetical protein
MSNSKEAFEKIERQFTSSNNVDVERATILRADWELAKQYMSTLKARALWFEEECDKKTEQKDRLQAQVDHRSKNRER